MMVKKILLSLASIFLIWQSYKLLLTINNMAIDSWGLSMFMAWIINLFITGIFAFAGFAFPTERLLPNSYYKIHYPKKLKKAYGLLGVDLFRKMLLATLWRSKDQRQKYFNGTKAGIKNLVTQSKKSEFGHLLPLIILCAVSIYFMLMGLVKLAFLTFLINIIGNLYPMILQRHHRMRIQVLINRFQTK